MRKRGENGILILAIFFFFIFFGISLNFLKLSQKREYVRTAADSSFITIQAGDSGGTIYDRNFLPLINGEKDIAAVAVPDEIPLEKLTEYAADTAELEKLYSAGKPFAFECTKKGVESQGLTFFEIPRRYSENVFARGLHWPNPRKCLTVLIILEIKDKVLG